MANLKLKFAAKSVPVVHTIFAGLNANKLPSTSLHVKLSLTATPVPVASNTIFYTESPYIKSTPSIS